MSSDRTSRKPSAANAEEPKIGTDDLGRILMHLPEGALLVDLAGRKVLLANDAFYRQSGYGPGDLPALELAHLHDLRDLERILGSASRPNQMEEVIRAVSCSGKDDRPFTADVKVTGLRSAAGSLVVLTYAPSGPGNAPASGGDAPAAAPGGPMALLPAFTLQLATAQTQEDLGRILIEASEKLMESEVVLLMARRTAPPGTEILLSTGLKEAAVREAQRSLEDQLAGLLVSRDRPLIIDPGSVSPATELAAAGVRALLIMPLEMDGRLAGAWALGYRDLLIARTREFEAGRIFAAHLSGTLAGIQLLERTRKEKVHQEVLNKIISCLRGPFKLDEFLSSLTGELSAALDADCCWIMGSRTDEEQGAVRVDFEHVRNNLPALRGQGSIPFAGTALGNAVLYSKEPLVVDDLRIRPDLTEDHEALFAQFDLRGLIMAKILSREGLSGLVAVATSGKPRQWAPEEMELVRAVADHISVTLETGRLMKANEDRARQLNLLTEVQQAVGRLRDVGAVLQEAVEALCRSFGYRQARIATLSLGGELVHRAWAGEEERIASGPDAGAAPSEPEMLARRAAGSRQTQIARDLSVDDVSRVAEMALPLVGSDDLLGVLSVRSDRAEDFDERGRKVLERFANNLVMAIQNARLYEAERGRSRRLQILGALQSDAGPMGSPADMVRRAARAITEAYPEIDVWITGVADVALREFPSGPPAGAVAPTAEIDLSIRKGDRELGLLHLRHRSAAAFPDEERRTFALLADRLAIALENAALFSQIEVERREWERTFDAIPDMLSIHDGYGRMLRANQSLQVRLGGEIRPFLGRDCSELLEIVVGKSGGCPHLEALQTRRTLMREIQGERGVFTLMAIPCFDETGDCLYIIHICREITEEKQIREQLLHNEKMVAVGSLVSGVAHELNNPLAGVSGFAQLLLERSEDPKLRKTLERIRDEADRAAKIVKNLLTFARKHKPESSRISINTILERTLELRAYDMRVSDIKVSTEFDPDLPPTFADPNQLQQVFLNVIVNAEHAMKDARGKGHFKVGTAVVDGRIRITLEDDGPGIKPEHLKQIFDPFFTTKTVGKGTGLGLSICKAIVREHGGSITATSTVDRGTTFTIDLPVVVGKETKVEAKRRAPLPISPSTILVVDDESSMRELIRDALTARGHTVDAVENGLLALQAIKSRRYDLVVSDLKMPGMSGQELFARLRTDAPELVARIIFTSGDSVSPETRNFLEGSGRPYLLKPFEVTDMVAEAEKVAAGQDPPPRNVN